MDDCKKVCILNYVTIVWFVYTGKPLVFIADHVTKVPPPPPLLRTPNRSTTWYESYLVRVSRVCCVCFSLMGQQYKDKSSAYITNFLGQAVLSDGQVM